MTATVAPSAEEQRGSPVTVPERVALLLAPLVVAGILLLLDGAILWTRPLWLDEVCCTLFVVEDAKSPLDVIGRVARGEDYAPPLLHLLVWTAGRLANGVTPVLIRVFSFACVTGALAALYLLLRRRFDRLPALAAVLAVMSHRLVQAHAFEGRFYGPWLLFAVLFACALDIDAGAAPKRRAIAIAFTSVLLATIHWFGVLSLGLMTGAALLAGEGTPRARLRSLWPAVAGVVAIAACVPIILAHRSSAASLDVLWVPPLSGGVVGAMARLFFLSTIPVGAVILLLIESLRDKDATSPRAGAPAGFRAMLRDAPMAALLSLALIPVLLAIVSVLLQPSLLDRYAMVTVLWWAPLTAMAVATLARGGRVLISIVLVLIVVLAARRTIEAKQAFAREVQGDVQAFAQARALGLPIVFSSLFTAYPVAGRMRDQRLAHFIVLPDSTIARMVHYPQLGWLRRRMIVERNSAMGHARTYRFPVLAPLASLDTMRAFALVGSDESLPRLYTDLQKYAATVFPRHRARRETPHLAIFER